MSDLVLAKIDNACRLLSEAKTIQEAKHIADVAEAARVYAKRVEASIETVNYAAEIKIRAERLLGDMLAKSPKNKGAREPGTSRGSIKAPRHPAPLEEVGVSKKQSARSQKLARIPAPKFEQVIGAQKHSGKAISTAAVLRASAPYSSQEDDGDSDETCWRRGLLYRAQSAAGDAAFENWSNFQVDLQLVNAATRAAQAWGKTAEYLRKLHYEQKKHSRAA